MWIIGHHDDITRRSRRPPFSSTITPQCGDPAKMKWMFKEDHSLGKRGSDCYETRDVLVMSCTLLSVFAVSISFCIGSVKPACHISLPPDEYTKVTAAWLTTNANMLFPQLSKWGSPLTLLIHHISQQFLPEMCLCFASPSPNFIQEYGNLMLPCLY